MRRPYEEEEVEETEVIPQNEDLQEHQKEKDTHRYRRKRKELEKQKDIWKQKKPRGKKIRSHDDWDEADYF